MKNDESIVQRISRDARLRLALVELDRIEREIAALTGPALDARQLQLLLSLRSCRATLLRRADLFMRRAPRDEGPHATATQRA